MKKLLISLIFALPVLFFCNMSYADGGVVYESPFVYNSANNYYLSTDSGFIAGYRNGNSIFWYSKDSTTIYLNGSVPYASGQISSTVFSVDSSVQYFTDLDSMLSALQNSTSSSYDSSIGIGSEFFIVQQGNAFDTQRWGIFWKTPNCSSCKLMISGGLKTDNFDVGINSSLWINPSDYATDNSNIVLFLTPLDSSENWGNTMSISHYFHSNLLTQGVENAIQLFQGYIAKADNIPDVNIIGIDTVDVVDYSGRPDTNGTIDTTTIVNTTTIYSPVYNTTSETVNNVFNEYITNETVYNSVTNNYYTTNNYINNTTNLSIDLGGGDSDSKENLLIKFLNSRKWFNDTSDEVLNSLKDLKGTPFEFIFDTVSTCLVALVGIAIVLLLVKVVGFFV